MGDDTHKLSVRALVCCSVCARVGGFVIVCTIRTQIALVYIYYPLPPACS